MAIEYKGDLIPEPYGSAEMSGGATLLLGTKTLEEVEAEDLEFQQSVMNEHLMRIRRKRTLEVQRSIKS